MAYITTVNDKKDIFQAKLDNFFVNYADENNMRVTRAEA
jgi:hypothetical protein